MGEPPQIGHPTADEIILKTLLIRPGMAPGSVWLERINVREAGEGGDFDIAAIDALLSAFYDENF
jgi:hypothetical protein